MIARPSRPTTKGLVESPPSNPVGRGAIPRSCSRHVAARSRWATSWRPAGAGDGWRAWNGAELQRLVALLHGKLSRSGAGPSTPLGAWAGFSGPHPHPLSGRLAGTLAPRTRQAQHPSRGTVQQTVHHDEFRAAPAPCPGNHPGEGDLGHGEQCPYRPPAVYPHRAQRALQAAP